MECKYFNIFLQILKFILFLNSISKKFTKDAGGGGPCLVKSVASFLFGEK